MTGGAAWGAQVQPRTVGQAGRIGGVNPSDITNLLIHLEVLRRQRDVSRTHPSLPIAVLVSLAQSRSTTICASEQVKRSRQTFDTRRLWRP